MLLRASHEHFLNQPASAKPWSLTARTHLLALEKPRASSCGELAIGPDFEVNLAFREGALSLLACGEGQPRAASCGAPDLGPRRALSCRMR